jgi:phosphatidylglycerophosphate synthase
MSTASKMRAFRRERIPWAMAAARAGLGPVLILGAALGWNPLALPGIVATALLSDIFDGVLARRWGCDTAGVRRFDTLADTVFYVCVAVALWLAQPEIWRRNGRLLAVLLGLELARLVFDMGKFGKAASYHSCLAKTWGLVMAIAVIGVFALGRLNPLIPSLYASGSPAISRASQCRPCCRFGARM